MFFPEPVLFEVPVLPRVRKYMSAKLTDSNGQVMPMLVEPEALGPGLMLWAMAQSEKVHLYTNFSSKEPGTRRYDPAPLTARIGIGIREYHPSRHQYLLNTAELWVFSNMVDHMVRNELVQYCDAEPAATPMSRIKQFCDHYDFSEADYAEQTLRQVYLRHRKGIGAAGFSPQVSRHFCFIPMLLAA